MNSNIRFGGSYIVALLWAHNYPPKKSALIKPV